MNLLSEFRAQFSLREWLCAMKQGVKELMPQISLKEWIAAFLFYVPTANKPRISGKYKTIPGGTSDEIYNALTNLQKEMKQWQLK